MASINKNKKTGKWYARVSYKDSDGNYRTKSRMGFDTKAEAELAGAKLEILASEGVDLSTIDENYDPQSGLIFANYFEEWIKTYKEGVVSERTLLMYDRDLFLVREFFSNKKIDEITRSEYQQFINQRGKNRTKGTVSHTHGHIRSCVKDAVLDGVIDRDFTARIILRYDIESSNHPKAWSLEESKKLLRYFESSNDARHLMLYICLTTGLRLGEVYGLAYEDITPNGLSVRRGYDPHRTFKFTKGKTPSAIRDIVITQELYNKVQKYRLAHQRENKEYLFLDRWGKPLVNYLTLLRFLKRVARKLDIPTLTIHSLRHTHCSILIYKELDIHYISKRLGHASTVETIETYSHIIDELQEEQDDKVIKAIENLAN